VLNRSLSPASFRDSVRALASAALLLLFPLGSAAANLSSVTVNPAAVMNGSRVEVTIALDGAAPVGGVPVTLTISDPGILNAQGIYVVGPGATSKSFTVDAGSAETSTQVTLSASFGGATKMATLTVTPRSPVRGAAGDLWADVVLGKPDFDEIAPNEVTSRRLFNPQGVLVDRSVSPNRVYVYDGGNSRVLGLSHLGSCASGTNLGQNCTANSNCPGSTCAIEEGRGADLVLGQPSFTRSACNGDGAFQRYPMRAPASAATLCSLPDGLVSPLEGGSHANMAVDGAGNLYVPDFENHRVLRYNSPFTTDTIADDVWGQADFTGNQCNRGRGLNSADNQSLCFASPYYGVTAGVGIDSTGNLWVADVANNRVLRFPFDVAIGSPSHVADLALGQPDLSHSDPAPGLNQMRGPTAVRVDSAGAVYVAEYSDQGQAAQNNRVLIFDPPFSNGQTARTLAYPFLRPESLEFDPAGGLWVNDSGNTQLLLFVGGVVQKVLFRDLAASTGACGSAATTGDGPPFSFEGNGGDAFSSWNLCRIGGSIGVDSDGNVLVAALHSQDVWRFPAPFPTPTKGIAHSADARIFKPYQSAVQNEVGLAGIIGVSGVAVAAGQLIVADNTRLLFWNNPISLTSGQAADGFVGTSDPRLQNGPQFGHIREDGNSRLWAIRYDQIVAYNLPLATGASPAVTITSPLQVLGGGKLTWDGLLSAGGVAPVGAGDKVWVADAAHNRVFRVRNPLTAPMADIVLGQTGVAGIGCNQGHGAGSPSRTSLCNPNAVELDRQGNLYVSDHSLEAQGNFRLLEYDASLFPSSPPHALFAIPASRVFGAGGSFTLPSCQQSELCTAFWDPGFDSSGQMVVGGNSIMTTQFPFVYTNPLVSQHVSTYLNDFYSMGYAATFDSSNNLYVGDLNRGRVLIYLNPLPAPPATFTLNVTKAGSGTGTVKSSPPGIDCGTVCSQLSIDGASVTLSTVAGTNSLFAGWSGDADCSDGIVTMSAARTCTAGFDLKPDLIVSVLTVPTGAVAGSTISVTDTTKNQTGTGQAPASTTKLYLSSNSTWDTGDTLLGSREISTLAPGGTNSGSTDVMIPAGKATGNYYIIAKADADGSIPEMSYTNNTKAAFIRVSPPDLVVSAFSVPTTGGADLPIKATNTTKNQVNAGPAPASTTRFYLSTNSTLDGSDPEIGFQLIGVLAPGASETYTTSLMIPGGTAKGTYYVIAKADADSLITEALDTNNTASDTIVIGPDLIVSALTVVPTSAAAGADIKVTDTTTNQGGGKAADSTTSYYLSTNTTLGGGDVLLASRSVGTLTPGQSSPGPETSVSIPLATTPATYYILAVADAPGAVPEAIENNNTTAKVIKITH
jgi:hypothetical protein